MQGWKPRNSVVLVRARIWEAFSLDGHLQRCDSAEFRLAWYTHDFKCRKRERLVTGSLLVGSASKKHGEEGWNRKISFCFFSFFFSSPPTNEPWETLGLQARAWHWLSMFSTAAFNSSLPPFYTDYFKISIESNALLSHFWKCAVLLWTPTHSLPRPACPPPPALLNSLLPFVSFVFLLAFLFPLLP